MTNFEKMEKLIIKKIERGYVAWMKHDDDSARVNLYHANRLAHKHNIFTYKDQTIEIFGMFITKTGDFAI